MLNTSPLYPPAIVGAGRWIVPRALIDLVDPDITYGLATASGHTAYSKPEQIYDKVMEVDGHKYATLEQNRWILDGTWSVYPDDPATTEGEQGIECDLLSDENGGFTSAQWVQLNVTGLSTLQAASVYFTGRPEDGVASDFTLDIYCGDDIVHSEQVTGNTAQSVSFEGFTTYDVTAIRVTATKWSTPHRRMRLIEIIPGIYEQWDGNTIYAMDVIHQADVSCMTLPYGSAILEIRNETRRFDPTNKSGLFLSVEARQGIPLWYAVYTPAGFEYIPLGVYYQQNGGWSTANKGLTMRWKLVDIIGLLATRKYRVPAALPDTLAGWLASIVAQLGDNFVDRYMVDGALGATPLTCPAEALSNVTCGSLLRYVCQATGAYLRADAETGYLRADVLPTGTAHTLTLDNMAEAPTLSANDDIAAIVFQLGDEQYVVGGTNT